MQPTDPTELATGPAADPSRAPASGPPPEERLFARVGRVAGVIASERFPTGLRAALKRMAPHQSPGLAFHRFYAQYIDANGCPDGQLADWSAILAGIARMTRPPQSGHQSGAQARMGAVLADCGYSEKRLERLLSTADPNVRRVLFTRATRFLAARGVPWDWAEAAAWLLSAADKREGMSHRIARDFYRNLFKKEDH